MMHANKLSVFLFVALGLLGGCSDSRRNLDLLPHDNEPSPGDESAEVERLRRLQMVRLINHTDPENSFEETVDPEVLEGYFRDTICQKELDTCALNGLLDKCNICLIDEALCIANHLLDVAGTRSTPVELELTTIQPIPPLYSIPPQPTATNAALARIAFKHYAPAAVFRAFRHARVAVGLDDLPAVSWFEVNPDPCDAGTTAEPGTLADRINPNGMLDDDPSSVEPGSISVAAALGQRVAESLSVFREAGFRTVELELAVADQQRSNPSLSHQVSRGLTGWELSRVSAAHLLVGGSPGLLGTTRDTPRPGVCSTPQLSAQGEKALGILRDAGISPAAVQADPTIVSLDELLNGDASDGVPDGSVKQRFGQRWGFNFDAPPAGIDVRESIGDYFHLRDEDFEEARRYLDQEITAFSRSQSAQIEPPPVAAGYRRFAGTAQPPKPLPAEYYATIASYNVFQRSHQAEPPILFPDVVPKPGGGQVTVPNPNMASVMDAALTHAALVLDEESVIPTPSLRRDLMTPLATMHMGDSGRGRAVICRQAYLVDTGLVFEFEFDVGGFKSTDGLAVVRGEDGLRCALDGSVEGGNCALKFNHTDVNQAYKLADLTSTGAGVSGFDDSASGSFAVTSPMDGERIYIVQRTATGSTPGSYKPLAGFHLESETQNNCFDVPIVPEVSKRVADIMAPSTKWCSTSQVSCAGTQFDERLPLEDELTNDSDGVESSWKHYLALAKEAAARSDQLGQEYVNSGLEFETRLESVELRDEEKERMAEDKALAAVDELQKICGTAIDPIRLLKLLSFGPDQNNLALVKDTEAPPCALGYKQILGSCVFDLSQLLTALAGDEAYSDFVRLNECLSEDSVKSFVHLGSKERPLCLWHEASDPRKLCVAKDATHPCPILAAPNGGGGWSCANLNLPTSTPAKIPVAIAESLELVDTRALSTFEKAATGEPLTTCDQIRKLRESPDATYLDSVRGTGRFTAARMTELAKRIAFRARYGSYSAVTLDGATRYSTGTAWSPPPMTQTSWPCAAATGIQGCPGPGLFCDKVDDCTQEQQRGRMNDRLVRAVLAINASLGDTYYGRARHAQFVWPTMEPRHMDNPNADAKLEGATARDFWENASISHPFTEYTSASGPIGPEGARNVSTSLRQPVREFYVGFSESSSAAG